MQNYLHNCVACESKAIWTKFIFWGGNTMKKVFLILSIIFIALTFVGAGYVLLNKGTVNAGYACVPMVFALASTFAYRSKRTKWANTLSQAKAPQYNKIWITAT